MKHLIEQEGAFLQLFNYLNSISDYSNKLSQISESNVTLIPNLKTYKADASGHIDVLKTDLRPLIADLSSSIGAFCDDFVSAHESLKALIVSGAHEMLSSEIQAFKQKNTAILNNIAKLVAALKTNEHNFIADSSNFEAALSVAKTLITQSEHRIQQLKVTMRDLEKAAVAARDKYKNPMTYLRPELILEFWKIKENIDNLRAEVTRDLESIGNNSRIIAQKQAQAQSRISQINQLSALISQVSPIHPLLNNLVESANNLSTKWTDISGYFENLLLDLDLKKSQKTAQDNLDILVKDFSDLKKSITETTLSVTQALENNSLLKSMAPHPAMRLLGSSFFASTHNPAILDFSNHGICDATLASVLARLGPTVRSLNLSNNNLSDACVSRLKRFMANNHSLQQLDLSGNQFSDSGNDSLCFVIQSNLNITITRLTVGHGLMSPTS